MVRKPPMCKICASQIGSSFQGLVKTIYAQVKIASSRSGKGKHEGYYLKPPPRTKLPFLELFWDLRISKCLGIAPSPMRLRRKDFKFKYLAGTNHLINIPPKTKRGRSKFIFTKVCLWQKQGDSRVVERRQVAWSWIPFSRENLMNTVLNKKPPALAFALSLHLFAFSLSCKQFAFERGLDKMTGLPFSRVGRVAPWILL